MFNLADWTKTVAFRHEKEVKSWRWLVIDTLRKEIAGTSTGCRLLKIKRAYIISLSATSFVHFWLISTHRTLVCPFSHASQAIYTPQPTAPCKSSISLQPHRTPQLDIGRTEIHEVDMSFIFHRWFNQYGPGKLKSGYRLWDIRIPSPWSFPCKMISVL